MLDGVVTTRAMVPLEVIDDAKGDMILTLRDVVDDDVFKDGTRAKAPETGDYLPWRL